MGLRGAGAMSFSPTTWAACACEVPATCRKCGRFFMAKRIDAMYCSAACMQEAYRRRKANRLA